MWAGSCGKLALPCPGLPALNETSPRKSMMGLQGPSPPAEPPPRAIIHSFPGDRPGRPKEAAKQTSSGQNQPQAFSVPANTHPSQCQTIYVDPAIFFRQGKCVSGGSVLFAGFGRGSCRFLNCMAVETLQRCELG